MTHESPPEEVAEEKVKPATVMLCQTFHTTNGQFSPFVERIDLFVNKRVALKELVRRYGKPLSSVVSYSHHDPLNRRAIPQTILKFSGNNVTVKLHNKIVQEDVVK